METQLFLGEPARKEEEGRREGEQALQEVGVSGCGVRRRPAPRAKGHGKKKKERERTAENRFVTLGLFLINQPFRKHHLYSSGRFSSAVPLSPTLQELTGCELPGHPASLPSLKHHSPPLRCFCPDANLRERCRISDWRTGERSLISLNTWLSGLGTIHNPFSIMYSFFKKNYQMCSLRNH